MIALAIILRTAAQPAHAQSTSATVSWSAPVDVSSSPYSSASPAIVADPYGNIHVLWSEEPDGRALGPNDLATNGNTIYYTRYDGRTWSPPIDVLYNPNDPIADFVSVAVDRDGRLHTVWSGNVNIYYSNAAALDAGSAQAWSTPVVIATNNARTMWESSIAVDSQGRIHVIYATRGSDAGVYYINSTDEGATWSGPVKLSEPFESLENGFSRVKIIVDEADRLHTVWQTTDFTGFGQAIYYTRSSDAGAVWERVRQMSTRGAEDFDVGWPYIASISPSNLIMIYNAGPNATGRYQRVSDDGGVTWTEPRYIIPDMQGINGYVIPLVDAAGQLHLIINMRSTDTQNVGIYYATWQGNDWSAAIPLQINSPAASSAHYAAATINKGNEIHVVWNQIGGGEIWSLQGTVQNVTPTASQVLPTAAAPTPLLTPPPAAVPTREVSLPQSQVDSQLIASANSVGDSPLIPGIIAASAVIVVVVGIMLTTRSRRPW
jgi:hypothetical protein